MFDFISSSSESNVSLICYQGLLLKFILCFLQVDKTNLQRKVAELDDMVKKLCGAQTTQSRVQQQMNSLSRSSNSDFSKRLTNSEKQLLRVNDELSQYYKSESSHPHTKLDGRGTESMFR